ncbi:MAG: PKD-like family lipoprotein [Bacteroidales bacterium]|nr:PKD-like family lipoprotein [Bacteroides sp.]MCM1199287.1 PKD-like family lipoprotein [Clostridium sp.]MCM1501371.1 PKD-like family lipoprotein [Bacteroidales bacterium]
MIGQNRKYGRQEYPKLPGRMAYLACTMLLLGVCGCFRDLGNYDYTEINQAVIGDAGFDREYNVRLNEDILRITPEISFTLDPEEKGRYRYEWVAVGQNFLRGQRFTISTERNLEYPVRLAAETYILYLKVTDLSTDMVFSKDVALNVMSLYTKGWLLAGEDSSGNGQMDMVSFSGNTLFLKNTLGMQDDLVLSPVRLVWIDNNEYTSEDRVYAGTESGTYKFDRESFTGSPYTDLKYSFALAPEGRCVMTDCQKISDKRHVVIVDGRAHEVSSDGGMIGNTFSYTENGAEFEVAPQMICNHRQVDVRTFGFYSLTHRRFGYISGLSVKNTILPGDGENDQWSWDTSTEFEGGLDFIAAIESFFSNGQSTVLMQDPSNGDRWIYGITAERSGTLSKGARIKADLSVATDFDKAENFIVTTNHGYMIYSAGNRLYGYNFRKSPQECTLLKTFDAPVTCIKADLVTDEQYQDNFYVATYDDAVPQSGVLYKFHVEDSPDRTGIRQIECWDKGFLKIHSICYKQF